MIEPEKVPGILEQLRPYFCQLVECQLRDYGESANSGVWVSFRLPEPECLEVFRGRDRSGRNARSGQRYTLMLVELNDQDEHVNHEARESMDPRPRKLSQIAGGLCHDAQFMQWVAETYGQNCTTSDEAAEFVRSICGVTSRSLLDSDAGAVVVFREILQRFDEWKREQV